VTSPGAQPRRPDWQSALTSGPMISTEKHGWGRLLDLTPHALGMPRAVVHAPTLTDIFDAMQALSQLSYGPTILNSLGAPL
jgi:hypothetical protein